MPRTRSKSTCCACLATNFSTTIKLSDLDENKVTVLNKLETAIPEVVWLPNYLICEACMNLLNIVYNFRKICLHSDTIRREKLVGQTLKPKIEKKENIIEVVEEVKVEELVIASLGEEVEDTKEEEDLLMGIKNDGLKEESNDSSDCDREFFTNDPDYFEIDESKSSNLDIIMADVNVKDDRKKKVSIIKRRKRRILCFECEKCGRKFTTSTKLIDHCVEEHEIAVKDVRPFACQRCPRRFGNSSNLLQHVKYHDAVRSNVCTYCGKGFITKTDLNIHEKQHLNKREYKCEECDKCFNTHKDLRSHKLVVHTDSIQWKYLCVYCDKRFPIKSNYDCHMRRHTGDKKFHCHLCDKKFTDKCVLQRHMRTHSNVRDFKCTECSKEYKDKRVMQVHMAKVHGIGLGDIKLPTKERKYICHICPKAYYARNKLTRHLYTHSGEKPFFCTICERKFNDRSYVKQHMRKTHNLELENMGRVGVLGDAE